MRSRAFECVGRPCVWHLLVAGTILCCCGAGVAHGAANPSYSENVQKAYITDLNLIRANDAGTRIGITFLHELYKVNPDLDAATAVRLSDAVIDAWRRNYGPDRNVDFEARVGDLETLGKTAIDLSGGKVSPQNVLDLLKVTIGESARQVDGFERKMGLIYGEKVLQEGAAAWGNHYAIMQRPEALLDAFEFADDHVRARSALSAVLQRVDKVGLEDPISEWRRLNPEGDRALKLAEIDDKLDRLASSREELRNEMRKLLQKVKGSSRFRVGNFRPAQP